MQIRFLFSEASPSHVARGERSKEKEREKGLKRERGGKELKKRREGRGRKAKKQVMSVNGH